MIVGRRSHTDWQCLSFQSGVGSRFRARVANWVGKRQYPHGRYLIRLGLYREAVKAFEAAEKWYRESYGPLHPYVAAALIRQGWCNAKLGRIEDACRAYDRALEIIEATEGSAHPMAREIRAYLTSTCG